MTLQIIQAPTTEIIIHALTPFATPGIDKFPSLLFDPSLLPCGDMVLVLFISGPRKDMAGARVGTTVGAAEGPKEEIAVGIIDVGLLVGCLLGWPVGCCDGCCDGCLVCCPVGCLDG